MSDKTKAVKLSRAMREIPLEAYRLPKHSRKWKSLCRQLMALADFLATYGDGDGTRIQAGVNAMMRKFRVSRRTVFYWLDDLKELGILTNTGKLTSMHGTRVRQLHPAVLAAKAGVQNTIAPNRHCNRHTLPPPPPPQTNAPNGGAGSRGEVGVIALQRAYRYETDKVLPASGNVRQKLSAMLAGYSEATIARAVEKWVRARTAPAGTLRNPAQFLLDELPDFLVANTEEALAATAAELKRAVEYVPTPEEVAAQQLRDAQQDGFDTVQEWQAWFHQLEQDCNYEKAGDKIMQELELPAQDQ